MNYTGTISERSEARLLRIPLKSLSVTTCSNEIQEKKQLLLLHLFVLNIFIFGLSSRHRCNISNGKESEKRTTGPPPTHIHTCIRKKYSEAKKGGKPIFYTHM